MAAVILSNEHLSAWVRTPVEIRRLERLCRSFAGHVTIIVYLRNQIGYLVSWYNTLVKACTSKPFDRFGVTLLSARWIMPEMLAPWSCVFGVENMSVRRFRTA